MEMAGWYLGDGWVRWQGERCMVLLGLSAAKLEVFKRSFPKLRYSVSQERTVHKIQICDTELAKWLQSNFGMYSEGKRIPSWVLSDKNRGELVSGYRATDGHTVSDTHWVANSVSPALAFGMRDLVQTLGWVGSLVWNEKKPTTVIEGRTVNQQSYWTMSAHHASVSRKSYQIDQHLLRRVSGFVSSGTTQTVYNIEVEEDHSYILNGAVVHNCQSFSVAGLRKGLSDQRGNLSLEFVRIADAIDRRRVDAGQEPAWILWENVPGVLTSKDNAFGCFLAGLVGAEEPIVPDGKWSRSGLVTGPKRTAAWRVLDAQYFGVAQRRRRVFVLSRAGSGGWACGDALLPIEEGVPRDPPSRREAGKSITETISSRSTAGGGLGTDFECGGGLQPVGFPNPAYCLSGGPSGNQFGTGRDAQDTFVVSKASAVPDIAESLTAGGGMCGASDNGDINKNGALIPSLSPGFISPRQLRNSQTSNQIGIKPDARVSDALSSDGPGACNVFGETVVPPLMARSSRGASQTPSPGFQTDGLCVLAFSSKSDGGDAGEVSPTLRAGNHDQSHANGGCGPSVVVPTYCIKGAAIGREPENGPQYGEVLDDGTTYTLNCVDRHAVVHPLDTGTPPTVYAVIPFDTGHISDKENRSNPVPGVPCHSISATNHVPSVAVLLAFDTTQLTHPANRSSPKPGDPCHPLASGAHPPAVVMFNPIGQLVSVNQGSGGNVAHLDMEDPHQTLKAQGQPNSVVFDMFPASKSGNELQIVPIDVAPSLTTVAEAKKTDRGVRIVSPTEVENAPGTRVGAAVRRLTPKECERLQGFPDSYTLLPFGKKADGPRYKALGNSMAVPVIRWLGRRIEAVMAAEAEENDHS
jgi:site-specific DNA-cytosine methylase